MYFKWEEFPLIPPDEADPANGPAPVIIVGAGPVGLSLALGLARQGVGSVVLEKRRTISTGSRALAMTRRSMQILDQLGVGQAVLDKALTWNEGWTFYDRHMVHHMNIAPPPNEKHGQTNLQQCWMERLLLDEIQKYPDVQVRYGHEVLDVEPYSDRVVLKVQTELGSYEAKARYLVAADGPHGQTRKRLGLAYEGTSYTQQFVINDIICKLPIPAGRRLFFNPPYLPGKAVLMHQAPFDMWRLDFQLLDGQDAEEEMAAEKVHKRIRAHFELMGIQADYELLLTSVYRTNALSLPTYNRGRVLFAGDAAHQVPIFGGRGVNHGYADAHNLAWKLARVVKGTADATLLDTYTLERRGDILDTLDELTRTTLFITTPSPGVALMREAVLSLSIDDGFLANLFDPYASAPYRYSDSPLNATPANDADFSPRGEVGSICPDGVIDSESRLYELFGTGFALLVFVDEPVQAAAQPSWPEADSAVERLQHIIIPVSSEITRLLDARPGTIYLVRPDNRIAGRWRQHNAQALRDALDRLGGATSRSMEAS
ncbi:hypothetical protein CSC67_15320 [Pusillimonas caeni]|uniref:FAD-dependent monooxygenase n=1 Tax=Pusillimonas caeni TaxID=1348472 RepID=UPI000E59C540|nr:FAD-dependent monooxygenase [Pusillimonas caeni]TFL11357.1 hypothetical protein CSC67_15320 [Pusillimonas caeni]